MPSGQEEVNLFEKSESITHFSYVVLLSAWYSGVMYHTLFKKKTSSNHADRSKLFLFQVFVIGITIAEPNIQSSWKTST